MRFIPHTSIPLAAVPYVAVAALHLAALVAVSSGADASALVAVTKPLLMPALLLGFLLSVPSVRSRAVVLCSAALLFSWLGDIALMVPGEAWFLAGLCAFLAAHVAFLLLIAHHLAVRRLPLSALAYAGWWIALVALLAPHVSWLVWPLAAYGLVLGLMAAFATRARVAVAVGGLLFLASDSVLAIDRFLPSADIWQAGLVIMTTYILGQGLIAFGAAAHLRSRPSSGGPGSVGAVAPVMRSDAIG